MMQAFQRHIKLSEIKKAILFMFACTFVMYLIDSAIF